MVLLADLDEYKTSVKSNVSFFPEKKSQIFEEVRLAAFLWILLMLLLPPCLRDNCPKM